MIAKGIAEEEEEEEGRVSCLLLGKNNTGIAFGNLEPAGIWTYNWEADAELSSLQPAER